MYSITEINYLHDTIYNATHKSLSHKELIRLINKIPTDILWIGLEWGFSDTVFRDSVFGWIKENDEIINNLIEG